MTDFETPLDEPNKYITAPLIAIRWNCSHHKVLDMIQNGELKAVNLGTSPRGVRSRWQVKITDLYAFEESRSNQHLGVRARRNAANAAKYRSPSKS